MRKRGITAIIVLLLIVAINVIFLMRYNLLDRINITNLKELNIIEFFTQWIIIMMIIVYAYFKYVTSRNKEKKKVEVSKRIIKKTPSQTDFDVLYTLLKEEKSLTVNTIATIFKVKKEIGLEWAKILESNDLATVEYPVFGDPEVLLKVKKLEGPVPPIKKKEKEAEKSTKKNIKETSKKEMKKKDIKTKKTLVKKHKKKRK